MGLEHSGAPQGAPSSAVPIGGDSTPSHRVHKALARALLGDDWEVVNLFKDAPYKLFPGPKHREYFHDDATNFLLGVLYGPDAMLAGMLHDWADETFIERDGKLYLRNKAPAKRPGKKRKKRR